MRTTLFDRLLGRKPPINDLGGLEDFIDAQSAFLVQKGMYEYSRARAGHYSKVLFGETEFQQAVENSRWRAYPLGLAMVGELVTGVIEGRSGLDRPTVLGAMGALVLSVFDRYPAPSALGEEVWRQARSELSKRLDLIGLHPRKRVMDIPDVLAESYFALMPIHKKLRGQDFPTLKNYLKVTLCNVHDELMQRMDAQTIVELLRPRRN